MKASDQDDRPAAVGRTSRAWEKDEKVFQGVITGRPRRAAAAYQVERGANIVMSERRGVNHPLRGECLVFVHGSEVGLLAAHHSGRPLSMLRKRRDAAMQTVINQAALLPASYQSGVALVYVLSRPPNTLSPWVLELAPHSRCRQVASGQGHWMLAWLSTPYRVCYRTVAEVGGERAPRVPAAPLISS